MLAENMLQRIEDFYNAAQKDNLFFRRINEGNCSEAMVRLFVENILHLIRHTPLHLEMAARSAADKGLHELSKYLRVKLAEETGHDAWAEDDLKNLTGQKVNTANPNVTPAMDQIVKLNEKHIADDPELYLSHILFAEYFTVIATPPMVEALATKCNISPQSLTVFTKHAELDKYHVREWTEELPGIVDEKMSAHRLMTSLDRTLSLYSHFCEQVVERARMGKAA